MMDEQEFLRRIGRIEALVQCLEALADPLARVQARELVQAVLDLHRVGLTRLLALILAAPGGGGRQILDACAEDELVRSLLLLHGLHPRDLEARILTALETVQPFLEAQQSRVELLGVAQGIVRLRLHRDREGAPLLLQALRESVEAAVGAAAPDAAGVVIDESDSKLPVRDGRISLPLVGEQR